MNSMTGFGRAVVQDEKTGFTFKAEISSINKKQFDLKLSLPREFSALEIQIRKLIAERIGRGSLSARIEYETSKPEDAASFDEAALLAYYKAALRFQQKNGIPGGITISDLLSVPELAAPKIRDFSDSAVLEHISRTVNEALDHLIQMRQHEGETLKTDLLHRIDIMENTIREIKPDAMLLAEKQTQQLLEKIRELQLTADPNDERLLKEAVIYGDKLDVTEEITRLECHFSHFRKLAANTAEPVGRSLDFLVQEIFRECTTLGNKAASPEISPRIVELKNELEKIREQVQNIE